MQVRYGGPHARVEIPLPDGGVAFCERGGVVDLPDELGQRLTQQETWEPVGTQPSRPAAPEFEAPPAGEETEPEAPPVTEETEPAAPAAIDQKDGAS